MNAEDRSLDLKLDLKSLPGSTNNGRTELHVYDTTLKEPEVILTFLTSGVLTNKTVWRPCDLFTSPFIMGRVFLDHPGGLRIYSCANCDTPLTNRSELVSTVSGKEGFTVVCVCVSRTMCGRGS